MKPLFFIFLKETFCLIFPNSAVMADQRSDCYIIDDVKQGRSQI